MFYRNRLIPLFCLILAAILCLSACGKQASSPGTATDAGPAAAVDLSSAERLGEGASRFYFTVVFEDGSSKAYEIRTDETSVGAALKAYSLAEGVEGDYGLYVKTIGGVRADYNLDGAYWAFYIDGEYAMTGVDDTKINEGSTYSFVYTPADRFN